MMMMMMMIMIMRSDNDARPIYCSRARGGDHDDDHVVDDDDPQEHANVLQPHREYRLFLLNHGQPPLELINPLPKLSDQLGPQPPVISTRNTRLS